jgi:thiamine kinase-like enzyme
VRALCERARRLGEDIAALGGRTVLNHGDLATANLLGPLPVLVDWEYAQRADPVYDIACLLSYYPALDREVDRLLDAAGLDDARSRASLVLHRQLFEVFNALWGEAHGAAHGDPAGIVLRASAE